jgi:hypothetical protein
MKRVITAFFLSFLRFTTRLDCAYAKKVARLLLFLRQLHQGRDSQVYTFIRRNYNESQVTLEKE